MTPARPPLDPSLHDLLVWTAGAPIEPPRIADHQLDRAADLLDRHCLLGRFLHGADALAAPPGGTALVGRVRVLHAAVLRLIEEQMAALGEVAEVAGDDVRLVVLKGMATYQVVGDPRLARTGDVDVLTADGSGLADLLPTLGFARTRDAFLHEIGEFTRRAVEVDLHSHFPVYSLPSALRGVDMRPDGQPSTWLQRGEATSSPLTSEHFLASARLGRHDAPAGLRFAGPEILALVLAAHAHMNFTNAWSISHRAKPYVRLGELLDIAELVALPEFDHAELAHLAQEVGGGDALHWASSVAARLLGDVVLPGWGDGSDPLPPRCLWWDLWADVDVDTGRLLDTDWLAMDELVDALGATPVTPGMVAAAHPDTHPGGGPGRVLATSPGAPRFEVELSDARRIDVRVPDGAGTAGLRLRVDLGSSALEWARSPEGHETAVGTFTSATWSSSVGGGLLRADLPDACGPGPWHLFVGVSRLDGDGLRETTLLPLVVDPRT